MFGNSLRNLKSSFMSLNLFYLSENDLMIMRYKAYVSEIKPCGWNAIYI